MFNNSTTATDTGLISVTPDNVYDGNGNGGQFSSTSGLLKMGTSAASSMVIVFSQKVEKVEILCHNWNSTSTDKLSVNNSDEQQPTNSGKADWLTFELSSPSETITISGNKRLYVFQIKFTIQTGSGSGSGTGEGGSGESGESGGGENTESIVYTLEVPTNNSVSQYTSKTDVTVESLTWNVEGNLTSGLLIGGKYITGVDRVIYGKSAISQNVSKVVVSLGDIKDGLTLNSIKLEVYSTAEACAAGTGAVSTLTGSCAANSSVTFDRPDGADWTGCYYRIVFNVTVSGNSNKSIAFTSAEFYA